MCCLLCIEVAKDKMTPLEIARALMETKIDYSEGVEEAQKHIKDMADILDKKGITEEVLSHIVKLS